MERVITVGLGELVVSDRPEDTLVAYGLGSCVGISAYDPQRKLGALLHALLPQHRVGDRNPSKFVDTGIAELLDRMLALGASRGRLIWRIAGGAQMLVAPGLSDRFNIGAHNVAMAREVLARQRMPLLAHDTGGYEGRTLRLFIADGRVWVRKVNGQERSL